jgi:gamma-polyglutamate synthase
MRHRNLRRRITETLDPLRARLRRDEIAGLARAVAAREPSGTTDLALALALLDHADELATSLAEAREAGPREDAARRALDGEDEADAAVERDAREAGRANGAREVAVIAAAHLYASAADAARLDAAASGGPLAPERLVPGRLAGHALDGEAPWTVRVAALEALALVFASAPFPPPPRVVDSLDLLADDETAPRWVQVAAARTLGAADPERARCRVHARLLDPRPAPNDFLVRARLCRVLIDDLHDADAAPALVAAARDPSEHIRQSAARACTHSGEEGLRDLLFDLADPRREPSPKVRGVVAEVLGARALGSAGETEKLAAAETLALLVIGDADPLARRVACDEAARVCAEADRDVLHVLSEALERARSQPLPPAVANAVARAAERAAAFADPERAALRDALLDAVARLPERGAVTVRLPPDMAAVDDAVLGRALAELAQDDFGLYAERKGRKVRVRRGERTARLAWRVLHEVTHPLPTKRQGHVHTIGRLLSEPLRAHPATLAEVTRTRVPGERVLVAREDGWAQWLPLVDDLLGAAVAGRPARVFHEHGVTVVEPPRSLAARLLARAELTRRYAELAAQRLASLEAADPTTRAAYAAVVRDLGFTLAFEGQPGGSRAPRHVRQLFAGGVNAPVPLAGDSVPVAGMLPFAPLLGERMGGGVAELAAFTAGATALLVARSFLTRAEVRACRKAVPLVIGGWGTRGKSGVERLKAAVFHALGYETLTKTTGCEATVLVGVPGRPLVEVPLYRPWDKATIWEQRDVLRLAGRRRPHVLLWECMALNPRYVDHLQRGWMRDDYATLTNAYPDHEDVQGPSGLDVARAISHFTPEGATLVTAEEQMLPVFRAEARARRSEIRAVPRHAADLLPDDLLARFPYREHPRNVALVLSLAEELGLDRDVALVEMADHVLADIGGLRVYGPLAGEALGGRRLRFVNGMSANERVSALDNWKRLGFDRHSADAEPGRWVVAFVNNRADRPGRLQTFAEAIVHDLAAHRVVLVGTGIGAMRREIELALRQRLAQLPDGEVAALLAHMKVGANHVETALAELFAWIGDDAALLRDDPDFMAQLAVALEPIGLETLDEARRGVMASGAAERLGALADDEVVRFAVQSWIARRVGAACRREPGETATRDRLFTLFRARILVPPDPNGEADDLVAWLAGVCPPGTLADVMGLQNIKGPGLAIVRRLVELESGDDEHLAARAAAVPASTWARMTSWLRGSVDHIPSVGRRRRADRVFDDLARGRLACARAARELANLVEEQRRS